MVAYDMRYANPLPGPHPTFRMQYQFAQQFANADQGLPPRPWRTEAGPQARYLDYNGGPVSAPNQLVMLNGLRGVRRMSGLGALIPTDPSTYAEFHALVLRVVSVLEAAQAVPITYTDVGGASHTMSSGELAAALRNQYLGPEAPSNNPLPGGVEWDHAIAMLDEIEQQALPWYRKRGYVAAVSGTVLLGSVGLSAYHGYRRGGALSAFGWGLLGFIFPIITPAVAFAQGYGKRKR